MWHDGRGVENACIKYVKWSELHTRENQVMRKNLLPRLS